MNRRIALQIAAAVLAMAGFAVQARVVEKNVDYQYNGMTMKGYLAYDDAKSGPRPGVLVVHEWWGLNDYIRQRTRQLAQMGYIAFAPDMYGDGKTTRDPNEAGALSGAVNGELAPRAKAGLDILRKQPNLDAQHVGAMGFCFGGSTVLALAYSGEPLGGVVTFHGGLFVPDEQQRSQIRTPILLLHGEEDGFVKPETISELKKVLDQNKVDWYMVTYAHAVHAFTNPDADSFKIPGIGYNEKAAKRSWEEMQRFFADTVGK
ncbi:MAG TPA: dienelactone hydrolase family protein [Usitatibacter sp.]|nr:dienelactone hydrolase family protein [Usitatibacter sp.]